MAEHSAIEWLDGGDSWNPVLGCRRISPGCENCYAESMVANRLSKIPLTPQYHGLAVVRADGSPQWTGDSRLHEPALCNPLTYQCPRRIFVCSMSDLFFEAVPVAWVAKVFAVMLLARRHTFLVLTKRPHIAAALMGAPTFEAVVRKEANAIRNSGRAEFRALKGLPPTAEYAIPWPLRNVYVGTSVESQRYVDARLPVLLEVPAVLHFASVEPLLEPVTLAGYVERDPTRRATGRLRRALYPLQGEAEDRRLGWVIVGGESGAAPRPFPLASAAALAEECGAEGVPFFYKQRGTIWARENGTAATDPHGAVACAPRQLPAMALAPDAVLAAAQRPLL